MTPHRLHRLLITPEIIVVRLADAALVALENALIVEHPLLDADPAADDPPIRTRARDILAAASRLRLALRAYRRTAAAILYQALANDLPL